MVIITCPETGEELDSSKIDFEAYAANLWHVSLRDIDKLQNKEAKRRYMTIINALKQEAA